MAKYVGKTYKVNNKKLGLRGKSTHFVYVQWYDPKNKNFKCRVISSLEEEKTFNGKKDPERKVLGQSPYHKVKEDSYCIFKKNKYGKLRDGDIESIPMKNMDNASHWYGFTKTVNLNREDLKDESNSIKYKKDKK